MEKLVLIDGNSLINRAFYATPLLSNKNGVYTNAVYGFINMFLKILHDVAPTYAVVAFDVHAPTFRHKMYGEYKGTRKPMPEELRPQIPLLKEILSLMKVTIIEKAGIEADDIIGTIAKHTNIQTFIYTGDKDSFQLVDQETSVCFTRRGISDIDVYSIDNFKEKTSLNPSQIIDLKALMGDSSDNIPGVKGVGEKTALNLLCSYQTLEGVYEHIDEIKGSLKEKLIENKQTAFLSKTLATINTDCEIETDTKKMKVTTPFSQSLRKKFIELELKTLYSKSELFESTGEDKEEEERQLEKIQIIKVDDLAFIQNLTNKALSIYCANDLISLYSEGKEYQFNIKQTLLDDGFNEGEILRALLPVIANAEQIILYDKKTFRHKLLNLGYGEKIQADDLSILKYLADFSPANESAMDVITAYSMPENTPAYSLYAIFNQLKKVLINENMESLYTDLELPLSDVLFAMEASGFKIDVDALSKTGIEMSKQIFEIENKIKELAEDSTLNVKSPMQIGELIFEKLKLGKGKKTTRGYSTTAEVLEGLEGTHPIIPLILKYRKLQKIQSTYIEGFKPLIDKKTGLIHTSFNQTVTSTGRLSSKEPNLQNIPIRDEEGKELRKFFVPKGEDRILMGADYSQIELRLLAAFSNSEKLIKAFNDGKDVHRETASKVFGIPESEITPSLRGKAKAVNFGVIYGITEYGLAKNIKTSAFEAKQYISAYFSEFPEVKEYMNKNVEFARKNGYAVTHFGRRRYIREINSSNFNLRHFGERVAMNMPLQGSGADVIKKAMLGVYNRLKKENLRSELILQIHDELIIDAFIDEEKQVAKILKEEMENAVNLAVKLTVEIGKGKNWFDTK